MFSSRIKNYEQKVKNENDKIRKEFLNILSQKD